MNRFVLILQKSMLPVLFCCALAAASQSDSLSSGVYRWNSQPPKKNKSGESRPLITGHTTDLRLLKIHTSTLAPGQTNHPLQAYTDRDELIVVTEGTLKMLVNDSSKTLGPGSIALLTAGTRQSFQNNTDKPAAYCVLAFTPALKADSNRVATAGAVVKDWTELPVKKTDKGESRAVLDQATPLFSRFEVHATTLVPGVDSHPAHTHRAEEIMLLMKGNLTAHIAGTDLPVAAGDVILLRPNDPHNVSNTGTAPCWYYALKWYNQ